MDNPEAPQKPDLAEADLVQRLKIREEEAFNELVKDYSDPVHNLAFRLLGRNREEAEDITQEVFLKAFRKIDKFRGDSSLKTWLFRITTNCVTNRFKYGMRLKRRESLISNNPDPENIRGPSSGAPTDPEKEYERKERREKIEEAILSLPESLRRVVILRDLEGLSYEEIAYVTSTPTGTVKSRLARGRERLRESLSDLL